MRISITSFFSKKTQEGLLQMSSTIKEIKRVINSEFKLGRFIILLSKEQQ